MSALSRLSGQRIKLAKSAKPIADFATIGLLVPHNKPVTVKAVAAPGASCAGAISGAKTVPLAATKTNAFGVATFATIPAGTFTVSKAKWTAKVTCTGGDGVAAKSTQVRSYDVLASKKK